MGIVVGFILVLFVPACILLPVIILLQDSKGEGLSSSAFGGAAGSSMQSVLGGQGAATFLSKVTTWLAIGFMMMALFLMRFYGETGGELKPLQEEAAQPEITVIPPDETAEGTTDSEANEASDATTTDETDSSSDSSDDIGESTGK